MSFFQNVLASDFRGNLVLDDRQYVLEWEVKRNAGRGQELVVAWNTGPYNLSGNDPDGTSEANLSIIYFLHDNKAWQTMSIDVTVGAASTSAVTAEEIVSALNTNVTFSAWFTASLNNYSTKEEKQIIIKQNLPVTKFGFYVDNGAAEYVLGFNKRAGVAELPSYFSRHTFTNRYNYDDSQNQLILLDPSGSTVDANIIDNAVDYRGNTLGLDSSTVQADWQLLAGRSGLFTFQKITVDGSDRITQIIEYPAGAAAGDFAKKIKYTYTGGNTNPDQITEIPYVLTGSDLVTP